MMGLRTLAARRSVIREIRGRGLRATPSRLAVLAGFSKSACVFFSFWTFGSDTARM